MKLPSRLWAVTVVTLLFTACVQPAAAPSGLQIVDAWARQATMRAEPATAAMTTTMPAANNSMTATAAMTTTAPMTGSMGLGMGGAMGAVYMTIRNPGTQPDRLVKAASDVAEVIELHTVVEKDGVMSMQPVAGIDVPAAGEATLKPGGFHVMLIGLTRDLAVGDTVTVTLTFEQAGELVVMAPVRER